jgi:hypothetical protein
MNLPLNPTQDFIARNPHLYSPQKQVVASAERAAKPLLNGLESRYCAILESRGWTVLKQAIRLRLGIPYKSYTPDLAYLREGRLVLVEVKGRHRFREKGIAKWALTSKTYPMFTFLLAEWTGSEWKETLLSA